MFKSGARLAFFALLSGVLAVPNLPAQIYVDVNTGSDERTGLNDWTNAVATISNGVLRAGQHAQNTVLVATGRYYLVSNIVVSSAITLRSWNNGALDRENTIVDGQGQTRCLYLVNTNATVAGFTFTGGNGVGNVNDKYGGGVYNAGGVLSNCLVLFNSASDGGGGVVLAHAHASAVNCDVKYNETTEGRGGAGVYIYAAGLLLDSVIACNTNFAVEGGGGVSVRDGATPANYKIIGCLISNNYSATSAGGIYVGNACPIISSNTIVSNQAAVASGRGGGIYFYSVNKGSVFEHSTVAGNSAFDGGGVYIWPNYSGGGGGVIVSNCTIRGNTAPNFGGGLYAKIGNTSYTNTQVVVVDSVIDNNQATFASTSAGFRGGGGVYWNAPGWMENCIITNNNSGATGGGLYLRRDYVTSSSGVYEKLVLRNCLVASNRAAIAGGVYFSQITNDKPARLDSCTVAGNVASNSAGGVFFHQSADAALTNTIVYHNFAPEYDNIRMDATSYQLGYCCVIPTNHLALAGGLVNVTTNDPRFAGWESMNFSLTAGSSCANTGINQDWMNNALDLDGRPRLDRFSRLVDMGCYERMPQGFMFNIR